MHDGPGQKPALVPEAAKVRKKLAILLATLDEDESVVVAFAGHGVQFVGDDKNYFCPSDADLTDRTTLVDLTDVFEQLQRCKAKRKLLLVDACRNDPLLPTTRGGSNVASVSRPPSAVPRGVLALFSCDARQESYEDAELGHGVFFDQVIRTWRGGGGPVTLDEFRRAVRVGTKNRTRALFDKVQTPVERGEVVLADEWVLNPRQAPSGPPEVQALNKATADGKYTNLLAVIHVPADKDSYGEFKDYGSSSVTARGGYQGLPKGYWVYVAPHWYIWEKEGRGGEALPLQKASVDGKYTKLLTVIHVPRDEDNYGKVQDYGPSSITEWGGYQGLPKGYWVYVAPHWYIWENSKEKQPR
jgi:hypothetical protein